jgi:hypothetical protein
MARAVVSGRRADPGREADKYPPAVLAAAVLAAEDVSFLLVGSAALWLRGERLGVGDTDAVIEPGGQSLRRVRAALADMAIAPRALPRVAGFALLPVVTVVTSYGKIDCLLERGRLDWDRLCSAADAIPVAGVGVLVAAEADALDLRRRFKE